MIREINHDPLFLNQPSEPATAEDLPVARDLLETGGSQGRMRGDGRKYDRRPEKHHCREHGNYQYGHAQSGHS